MTEKKKMLILKLTFPTTLFIYVSVSAVLPFLSVCDNSIWYKALPIFLLNVIVPFFLGKIKVNAACLITFIYVALGLVSTAFNYPLWHPGWVIFFIIPIIEVFRYEKKDKKKRFTVTFDRKPKKDDDVIDV